MGAMGGALIQAAAHFYVIPMRPWARLVSIVDPHVAANLLTLALYHHRNMNIYRFQSLDLVRGSSFSKIQL